MTEGIRRLVDLLKSGEFKKIMIVSGAGMSVAAGIPDFRSPMIGLYASLSSMAHMKLKSPTFVFDINEFMRDPRPFWWIFGRMWPKGEWPKPTNFHFLIALLEKHNMLQRCYTQNIDNLELGAGVSSDKLV